MPFLSELEYEGASFGAYHIKYQPVIKGVRTFGTEECWLAFLKSGEVLSTIQTNTWKNTIFNAVNKSRVSGNDEMSVDETRIKKAIIDKYSFPNGLKPDDVNLISVEEMKVPMASVPAPTGVTPAPTPTPAPFDLIAFIKNLLGMR
jgi:hypothetical protein